jgi:hypothetical protein
VEDIGLVMFDTSIPQQSPDSWRDFSIVPPHNRYCGIPWPWKVCVYADSDRVLGEGSCDGPLIVDPTQSVVVLVLYNHECGGPSRGEVVLVIRVAALVGYMSSHTSQRIPWGDWNGNVMVVEIPLYNVSRLRAFVLGSRVLLLTDDWRDHMGGYSIRAYDFSLRGCRALVQAGNGENKRMVMPNPKKIWFPPGRDVGIENMRALGDSLVSCRVSDSQEIIGLVEDLRPVREGSGVPYRHICLGVYLVVLHGVRSVACTNVAQRRVICPSNVFRVALWSFRIQFCADILLKGTRVLPKLGATSHPLESYCNRGCLTKACELNKYQLHGLGRS